jgi:hypothetical protein
MVPNGTSVTELQETGAIKLQRTITEKELENNLRH